MALRALDHCFLENFRPDRKNTIKTYFRKVVGSANGTCPFDHERSGLGGYD